MKMETKKDIFTEKKKEYFRARAQKKGGRKVLKEILDAVCLVTNMHRKAVIRKFSVLQKKRKRSEEKRGRALYYTPDVTAALRDIWDAGGEVCGELLHSVIQEYVSIFQKAGTWTHTSEATSKLCAMSEGTVKIRVGRFQKIRKKGKGISTTSPSLLKNIIPIFHGDWSKKKPGEGQIDTVAHCGHTQGGDFAYTLNYTDVSVLWCLLRAQWCKGQVATQESLSVIKDTLPWQMTYVHPDTGSEFINWHLKGWCDLCGVDMGRSRPYHKNDNMHVEERNGHVVRKWIGYIRLDCEETVHAMNAVYAVLGPYLNHFVASKRLTEKVEVSGKWKKKYEKKAKTPYQRVMEHPDILPEVKERLRIEHESLNPAVLKKEIDRLKVILYDTQRKHGNNHHTAPTK